jgi:hypothetical protein
MGDYLELIKEANKIKRITPSLSKIIYKVLDKAKNNGKTINASVPITIVNQICDDIEKELGKKIPNVKCQHIENGYVIFNKPKEKDEKNYKIEIVFPEDIEPRYEDQYCLISFRFIDNDMARVDTYYVPGTTPSIMHRVF